MRRYSAEEFRGAVEEHGSMVFSIALRLLNDYGTAEEVAQDVLLELFRAAEQPGRGDHLRFWLRRTTVHRATDALRRRKVRPEARAEEWNEDLHGTEERTEGRGRGLESRLEELIETLPESQRVAVVLRYTEGMSPQEISAVLDQPVATVKSNLGRGLALLRRKAAVTMQQFVRHGSSGGHGNGRL